MGRKKSNGNATLLADAGDHLRDVDEGALGAAERHGQRGVGLVQGGQGGLARLLADGGELLEDERLEGVLLRVPGLRP